MISKATMWTITLIILMSGGFPGNNCAIAQDFEYVGQCTVPQYAIRLTVDGDYAYVAGLNSGLHIINIADPEAPYLMGSCDTPGAAVNIAISGNYAFVADSAAGVQIINISNPDQPGIDANIPTQTASYGVFTDNNYLYVSHGTSGFYIYNIETPTQPVLSGSCNVMARAGAIYIRGNYAYVCDHGNGLTVIDVEDPSEPFVAGNCNMQCETWGIDVNGEYAYLATGSGGYCIIDIADPTEPTLVGGVPAQWFTHTVFAENHFAYMADLSYGVKAYDVLDPSTPVLLDTYSTPGNAYGIYARLNYVYVANDNYFTILRFNPPPHQCPAEAIFGQPAIMPDEDWWWGLPSDNNTSMAAFDNLPDVSGTISKIRFWGGPMYFTDDWQRCSENPMDFEIIFFEDDGGYPGAEICRTSSTATGIPTGILYPYNDLVLNVLQYDVVLDNSCRIDGGWISIQGSSYGGDPQDCLFIWSNSRDGDGDNNCLFWDGSMYEWWAFDLSLCLEEEVVDIDPVTNLPEKAALIQNYPNPFNLHTTIQFELAKTSDIKIKIYDLLGREMETLLHTNLPPGYHQISWNAADKPSGVYFYQIEAGDYIETKKMVLLK